ncbi:MAG: hypothetical protein HQK89_16330 [Nitrospirae bacterium]|nr:hypothetical protein [Nitrospirota bacterium]
MSLSVPLLSLSPRVCSGQGYALFKPESTLCRKDDKGKDKNNKGKDRKSKGDSGQAGMTMRVGLTQRGWDISKGGHDDKDRTTTD